MLFVELQRIDHAQQLIHVTTQWQIINHLMTYDAVAINQTLDALEHFSGDVRTVIVP